MDRGGGFPVSVHHDAVWFSRHTKVSDAGLFLACLSADPDGFESWTRAFLTDDRIAGLVFLAGVFSIEDFDLETMATNLAFELLHKHLYFSGGERVRLLNTAHPGCEK